MLVVGPPPVADQALNERAAGLDRQLEATASQVHVRYVSPFSELSRSSVWMGQVAADDGAYPPGEGYAVLADLLWPSGRDWLATPARP